MIQCKPHSRAIANYVHGYLDTDTTSSGSIIQGHTNLTEIKLAAELLWRVNVKPSQVALGFGFYGRAFTLQDPGCTSPGCPFSGGGQPGVCTASSGCVWPFLSLSLAKMQNTNQPWVPAIRSFVL
jgi:GH18 family chitinase